jgi:hypothetical protein
VSAVTMHGRQREERLRALERKRELEARWFVEIVDGVMADGRLGEWVEVSDNAATDEDRHARRFGSLEEANEWMEAQP